MKWASQADVDNPGQFQTFKNSWTLKDLVDAKLVREWQYWKSVKDQFIPTSLDQLPSLRNSFIIQLKSAITSGLLGVREKLLALGVFTFSFPANAAIFASLVCRDWAQEFGPEDFAAKRQSRVSLNLSDFITTVADPLSPEPLTWCYQAGYHGRHVHISDKNKLFRLTLTHSPMIERLSHAACPKCNPIGPGPLPMFCTTSTELMFPTAKISVVVPWAAGKLSDARLLFGAP